MLRIVTPWGPVHILMGAYIASPQHRWRFLFWKPRRCQNLRITKSTGLGSHCDWKCLVNIYSIVSCWNGPYYSIPKVGHHICDFFGGKSKTGSAFPTPQVGMGVLKAREAARGLSSCTWRSDEGSDPWIWLSVMVPETKPSWMMRANCRCSSTFGIVLILTLALSWPNWLWSDNDQINLSDLLLQMLHISPLSQGYCGKTYVNQLEKLRANSHIMQRQTLACYLTYA